MSLIHLFLHMGINRISNILSGFITFLPASTSIPGPGGGGVLPYMGYIGMYPPPPDSWVEGGTVSESSVVPNTIKKTSPVS